MSTETVRRRRRLSPDERRDQLMAATVEVLAARGYQAATAEAIVEQAGVSKGLLWHYFDDLDDLMEQTARRSVMTLAAAVGARLDLEAPAPELIRAAVHGAAALLTEHPAERAAVGLIIINLRRPDGSPRLDHTDLDELYTAQEAIFSRGQTDGLLSDRLDPRLMAVTYQGAVDAMLGYLESHPDVDPHAFADSVADILLDGFRRADASAEPPRR